MDQIKFHLQIGLHAAIINEKYCEFMTILRKFLKGTALPKTTKKEINKNYKIIITLPIYTIF